MAHAPPTCLSEAASAYREQLSLVVVGKRQPQQEVTINRFAIIAMYVAVSRETCYVRITTVVGAALQKRL